MEKIERYPLVMHRGAFPNIESKHVQNEAEESAAVGEGWDTKRPFVPEPEPEKPVLTLEERVSALEEIVAELRAKRSPGRPRKDE